MATSLTLCGVYVPLITPFDERDRVHLGSLQALAAHYLDAGVTGLVALATTGEATSLDEAERAAVVRAVAEVCADRDAELLVGAGTNDTRTTLARHAALAHVPAASASLAVVPYYVRPSETAIVAHFQTVAARAPVPVVLYNIPTAPDAGSAPRRSASSPRPTTSPGSSRPSARSTPTPSRCLPGPAPNSSRSSVATTHSCSPEH